MSKPIRQHFVPKSYLNNFSETDGDKYFIYGCYRDKKEKINRLSTRDICLQKNLYTIPTNDETKKYAIEHFYGENVDGVYPEVYKILTDDSIKYIDFDTRLKIVNIALSFYFRTPKYLNEQNNLTERMIRDFARMTNKETVVYSFLGDEIRFSKNEIEAIIREKKEKNRILFLSEHLKAYEKLVQLKLTNDIMVNKLIDDSEFITSDSPIIIYPFMDPTDLDFDFRILNNRINPFDVKNMILLPLDKKHMLTILPKMDENINDTIQRIDSNKINALVLNFSVETFSDNWILGSIIGIENHLRDQVNYNKETPENIKMFDDFKEMVLENKELAELMQEYGVGHEKVKAKLDLMKKNTKVTVDPNFMEMVEKIEKGTGNND